LPNGIARPAMSFEDDLRRLDEHVAKARRSVQRQKGLIVRLRAAAVNTLDAIEFFGCWNRTYDDWRSTEAASEQSEAVAAPWLVLACRSKRRAVRLSPSGTRRKERYRENH
jgi:hypothetical protein